MRPPAARSSTCSARPGWTTAPARPAAVPTSSSQAPGLSASGGYAEADLARDLGLDDDQLPPDAVTAYLDAADETFWRETERIAREHLAASATEAGLAETGTEPGR